MNPIIDQLLSQAQKNLKKIVLPEGTDNRVVEAAKIIRDQKIADVIVLGPNADINPTNSPLLDQFSQALFELRKAKGLTLDQAKELVQDPLYFGTMMVHLGLADGMVAGANHTTAETIRPALQIIKTKPDSKLISTFFIMDTHNPSMGENGLLFFADCGLNLDPNSEELAQIAIQTADSFSKITQKTPRVAMLSYSTNGSAQGESANKVIGATKIVKDTRSDIQIEGEIQADAALIPEICDRKFPDHCFDDPVNVLIFPDLNSGNIAYKLVERIAKANAYGPITQGINKPVNDLSRGCSVEDIVTTVAITSVQSN